MTRNEYKAKSTAARKSTLRAIRAGFASHVLFGRGMALLASMEQTPAMIEFRKREAMLDRVGSVGGADIGRVAYC